MIAEHFTQIQQKILAATEASQQHACHSQDCNQRASAVNIIAVSKGQPISKITQAYELGLRQFGENYLSEAIDKIEHLKQLNIEWHFIGRIQSNKTRYIAEHFSWVQSVDRIKVAERLNQQRPKHLPALNILVQVNISDEASKGGINEKDVADFMLRLRPLQRLKVRGLMAITKATDDINEQKGYFEKLNTLYQHLKKVNKENLEFDTLSMGMSNDFTAAITEDSNMVRIGTALFGKRKTLDMAL